MIVAARYRLVWTKVTSVLKLPYSLDPCRSDNVLYADKDAAQGSESQSEQTSKKTPFPA